MISETTLSLLTCILYFEIFRIKYRVSRCNFHLQSVNQIHLTISKAFDQNFSSDQSGAFFRFLWTVKERQERFRLVFSQRHEYHSSEKKEKKNTTTTLLKQKRNIQVISNPWSKRKNNEVTLTNHSRRKSQNEQAIVKNEMSSSR